MPIAEIQQAPVTTHTKCPSLVNYTYTYTILFIQNRECYRKNEWNNKRKNLLILGTLRVTYILKAIQTISDNSLSNDYTCIEMRRQH